MTQPAFVPITEADQVRPALRLETPLRVWTACRCRRVPRRRAADGQGLRTAGPGPGLLCCTSPTSCSPSAVQLTTGERAEDALVGCSMVASARAGLFGGPRWAATSSTRSAPFGFLGAAARPSWSSGARPSSARPRIITRRSAPAIVDCVPETTLRLTANDVRARLSEWRSLITVTAASASVTADPAPASADPAPDADPAPAADPATGDA